MAQDYIQLADRTKLAADVRSITVDATTHQAARQQLVAVPGAVLAAQGVALSEAVVAQLLNAGSAEANVDGSAAEATFHYQVAAAQVLLLEQVEVEVRDTGAWTGATFGVLAALADGIRLEVIDTNGATVLHALVPGGSVKRNGDFAAIPGARVAMPFTDTLQVSIGARIEGWPLVVAASQYVRLTVSDNLTGLDALRASIRGRLAAA